MDAENDLRTLNRIQRWGLDPEPEVASLASELALAMSESDSYWRREEWANPDAFLFGQIVPQAGSGEQK